MSAMSLVAALGMAGGVEASEIRLAEHKGTSRLMVDGEQFVVLGGELGNSSASCPGDIERIFPKLRRMNLNTVLVPIYWDLIEPEEGSFDFSLVDKSIDEARKNDLKLVFLWFGAWKNSMSCYAPEWFKTDFKKYPRACTSSGKPLEIASAFSESVFDADSRAFVECMSHIDSVDTDGTVLMVQIENEVGMLEDARDYSKAASAKYAEGVPSELTAYLKKHRKTLHPELARRWEENGMKMSGPWREVFGDDVYSDEYFMAWNYASYIGRMARMGRKVIDRPFYVNAAMNSRGRRPGEYPSAGPLAHLKDIWHAAAPEVDILAPDLYDKGFTDWAASYHLPDNPLFIPEIRRNSRDNAAQAFYVLGEHDAIGISPFSIENGDDHSLSPMVQAYQLLSKSMPVITKYQGTESINGLYFDGDSTRRVLHRDGMVITAEHYFTLPWDSRATDGSVWPASGAILIAISPKEYLLMGIGVVVKFENESETTTSTASLGEDGFLNSEADRRNSGSWNGGRRIGLASVDEVEIDGAGGMKFVRRLSGDETHQGRHVRIGVDDFKVLRVRLYEYE